MKLQSIQLKNFRQFYGETAVLRLSTSSRNHNVVVFHGSNGSGKTALLNAFTWALYEAFTRGFQYPDQLINKRALRLAQPGEVVDAWVEVRFEHEDRHYVLRRAIEAERRPGEPEWTRLGDARASLQWCGADGKWNSQDRVGDAIGRILPADLHSYFFFDGERIERIVQASKDEQVALGEATKRLLGLEVLVRGETHLNRVRKDLEKELQGIGDPETKRLLEEKQSLEEEKEQLATRVEEIAQNIEADEARRREIDDRLRRLDEVRSIQERRDQLQREQDGRRALLTQTRTELASLVSTKGFSLFLNPAIERFRSVIESLRERGELPAGIKRQFVDDLLDSGSCICDRDLAPGYAPRQAVEAWKAKAGLGDVEEKAIRMGGEIAAIEQVIPDTLSGIDRLQRRKSTAREELARIEQELDDIKEKLENSPQEEISGLEIQRSKIREAIAQSNREHGEVSRRIRDLDEKIAELEKKRAQHQGRERRQRIAQARVDAAMNARDRIREVRELLEKEFRKKLVERVARIFSRISVTPYVPELTDEWGLRLLESAGGEPLPVAASQGESQILSLSFIASIIEQAREMQSKRAHLPGPDSAVYPMVMDSPFGSLDPVYRHQVAEHVPQLADQVLLFLTQTQWRGEVEQSLSGRVAHSYVLTYFTPRDDIQPEHIEIDGESFALVKRSPNEFEYTEICEVHYG